MNLTRSPRRSRMQGVYYGWYMLAGASVMNALGGTIVWQGFAVFFIPVAESLGIAYWQTSLAFALARAENGVLGPITGWALDKFGYIPLILAGTLITGFGYILLSRQDTYIAFLLVYLCVVSIGSSTSFMQATTAALNTWFIRYRGLVMSINSAAFRLGGAIVIPLLSVGVINLGWQTTSVIVGIILVVAIAPLSFLFRRSPESMGLKPDGGISYTHMRRRIRERTADANNTSQAVAVDTSQSDTSSEGDFTTKQALKTPSFWILVTATTLRISVHGTIFLHFIPILVSRGEAQQTAANLVGAISLAAVPVIIFTGYISDRVGRPLMLTFLYSASAVSLLLITLVEGTWPIFLAMLLFVGSEAGSSLNWAIIGDLFGRARYATIRGMMAPIYNAALIVAPVAAGYTFDQLGTYQPVLIAGTILMFTAAGVFLILQPAVRRSRLA
ncbi:MAG: MFS transporter [Chloroflexi bacterium]|nr:MFS transporter [Chloroflexota bacterium]MYK61553.1 MFS transporter [Chloroflexota bacterium]